MKLFEERKALTESFEKLNRLFKEWERNPSALVRDSIKKKLIESYEHLENLDRLDLDRDLTENATPVTVNSEVEENIVLSKKQDEPIDVSTEKAEVKEITPVPEEIPEKIQEEPIVDLTTETAKEKVEESTAVNKDASPPVEVEVASTIDKTDVKEEVKSNIEPPIKVDSDHSFLSGDDEVELEKYFENIKDSKTEEKAPVPEKSIEKPLPKNEPIIEEKPRISAFFTKEEMPKEESKQLTLADKLSAGYKEEGVHYAIQGATILDLTTAIPIAKKFEFIKNLFADDSENYKSAIQNINSANNLQQALDIVENLNETFNWSENKELEKDLIGFVLRRFQ